ncbi:MAG: hypothetical protein K9K80_02850, partial [Spirochaetia bacterium]|nr:hypothetical protein [Spirochaetia bacterium]
MKSLSKFLSSVFIITITVFLLFGCATVPDDEGAEKEIAEKEVEKEDEADITVEVIEAEEDEEPVIEDELAAEEEKPVEVEEDVVEPEAPEKPAEPEAAEEPEMAEAPAEEAPEAVEEAVQEVELSLIHTGDALGQDKFGAATLATIVKYLETENNAIVVDAGNTLHGTASATLDMGASIIEVMNAVGYDAMVPGAYDFNFGKGRLGELSEAADFPIVSANIVTAEGSLYLPPGGTLIEAEGVQVGIFGLTSQMTPKKTAGSNISGLAFMDYYPTAKEAVKRLQEAGADVIVALTNIGLEELELSEEEIAYAAQELSDIDVIVNGSTGMALSDGYTVGNTLIVQTGMHNENVGVVSMTVR